MRLIKTFAAVLASVLAFPSVAVAGNTALTRGDIALRHVEFINDHLYGRITFTYRERWKLLCGHFLYFLRMCLLLGLQNCHRRIKAALCVNHHNALCTGQ